MLMNGNKFTTGLKVLAAIITAGFLLGACGGSAEKKTTTSPALTIKGVSGAMVDMTGTWTRPCMVIPGSTYWEISTVLIAGNTFTYGKNFFFTDQTTGGCTAPADYTVTGAGSATLGVEGTAGWVTGGATLPAHLVSAIATEATVTMTQLDITPLTTIAVTSLQTAGYCGYAGWALNTPYSILGTSCEPLSTKYWVMDDTVVPMNWYIGETATAWAVPLPAPRVKQP